MTDLDNRAKTQSVKLTGQYTAPKLVEDEIMEEVENSPVVVSSVSSGNGKSVYSKENDYQRRKYDTIQQMEKAGDESKSYKERMKLKSLENGQEDSSKEEEKGLERRKQRKRRWDVTDEDTNQIDKKTKVDGVIETSSLPTINGIELNDEILNKLLPPGFVKIPQPESYKPRDDELPDFSNFDASGNADGYMIPQESKMLVEAKLVNPAMISDVSGIGELQFFKEEDMKYFGKLIVKKDVPPESMSVDEKKEIRTMRLLLRIKNGSTQNRKTALRSLTENARFLGPKVLFDQILPLMMEKSLEDQERHLLVKVIDRILFKLDELIRPYTHKILIVIMPLLVDSDLVARLEGREIISNLSKAAGLAHMISTLRPDIDSSDDYVRNIVSRTFGVVAYSLGVQNLLPFLKAVCHSKKSWLAKHTGARIVQQIGMIMGSGILPHLNGLISCVADSINDENAQVRIMTANAIASLAESVAPYGIESFEEILQDLWGGMKKHRGRGLAAFLRAIGSTIPLMDEEYANYYTREVFKILSREFSSPDEEMKRTCLKVVQQCCESASVLTKKYMLNEVLENFMTNFWNRRTALDKRVAGLCVHTTVTISKKVGCAEIVERILVHLKDSAEPFRRMAVSTCDTIISEIGSMDLSDRTVHRLVDGLLVAFQEQTTQDPVFLNGFGHIIKSIGIRSKPHLPSILSTLLYRLKSKSPEVRLQAADLITQIAPVIKLCGEEDILAKLGSILYESLGEVFPDVLGSVIAALGSIVVALGAASMNPPISQILPTLTPILKNRHVRVQETTIELIGKIADKGKEFVNHREWMRISFELLEMLKASKKSIRVAANETFGHIAKAIGPADVLVTLLNNLKVQERQLRVCTAVAIGIVAKTCSPFTVLPALMNEYRTPEVNVQNGVLKAMTFMFEYIGDMSADYVYAVSPLLEDALIERDLVHRQTAATVVRHMALGCVGMGLEDVFLHFLNLLIPNIFETSPHVIRRIMDGIEGCRNIVGPGLVMNYLLAGLFHPARKVRHAYWRIFNEMYVQSCDAIVPFYPRLDGVGPAPAMEGNAATRTPDIPELDLMI
ncbi:unnamed protein product [Kuraishia capsulata CBS 1993]|uniref:Phosphatase PP2A regulatory subunit A/Splicing factor 3B subunit 1-like HEAT repeat domain-containing protein n=1 Tax=Kuraishia capsulata CBS 1993 TaxID=1382522 RepID=W6MMB7_9ASCO|nr:uncharacterized protein KUCA_T00002008001 [Kuraishia capsulata CBS 1993]CDK26037.1 unnamed protein product [Kuraishia capsulata CBS 1993]